MATVAKWAKDNWGITFTSVDPFNEPVATWWKSNGTQEGCHISPAAQASVISYLRTELNNRGLSSTIVSASDESYYDQATSTWNSFNSTTRSQVGRINTHGYQYSGGRRDLLFTAAAGKKLWNSEYGESDGTGMSLASNLNLDFSWLHMTAWCYWQPFDSGGWGLIQCNPGDNWMGPANPKYYVMAQYSRHIRSGMKIMSSGDANTVVAYDATAKKLVIVTANYGTAQWINFDLSKFTTVSGPISRWITVTGSGSKYEKFTDTSLSGKLFWSWFPANTVQTFEIQNVTP
jgi:galactan endo-1,6-beta-galactosidase